MFKNLSDEKVVEIVCKGESRAFGELVERYQDKLLRYATYLIRDDDVAADVVQDSFIKAYVNLKGFDTRRKFSSWMYRIVHNQAINEVKRRSKLFSLESLKLGEKISTDDDPIEKLEKKEIKKLVHKGLNKLDVKYEEPLTLFYLEEKSYEEISDILRIPVNTVGIRILRGKKMLSKIVLKEGGKGYAKN